MAGRGARRARGLLITVVVLVILLVAADRVGNYVAERFTADTLQSSQGLRSRPDVDIAGFPFLTQFAAGRFDKVTITAHDIPVGKSAHPLSVSQVRVAFHDVTVSRDFSRFHADTADATASIGYAELSRTLGLSIGYAGNGRVEASKSVSIAGRTVQASATARPRLADDTLSFVGTAINGAGELGRLVTAALHKVFDLAIPLSGIPFNVRVTSLHVARTGVTVGLRGRNLSYSH